MSHRRKCGILCHPTSIPGPYGIGDLGQGAYQLIDFMAGAGQSLWQILPLGPTGYGDSPYQPFSAFAGNPLLVSVQSLINDGWLTREEAQPVPSLPADHVDYGRVIAFKDRVLRVAFTRFRQKPGAEEYEFSEFRREQSAWLTDYALFMSLKQHFGWLAWVDWEPDIALHEPQAVERWRALLADELDYQCFLQWQFSRQWQALRAYANEKGIQIVGDVPIFVGHDSVDVWAHRELYYLDDAGHPTVVAGVPPDYFSPTGQLWGNPLYRWDRMKATGYGWWIDRLAAILDRVDVVRLDHFRGFAGYWEVPANEPTAVHGRWVLGPGDEFFRAVQAHFGDLPILAEDLGLISEDVIALRDAFGLPGMRVLQFAFGSDASNPHLPFNWEKNSAVYTATHDNDTTQGWYATAGPVIQDRVRTLTGTDGSGIHWTFYLTIMRSIADMAIVPLQDLLGLGTEARSNQPGRPDGNWTWRYGEGALSEGLQTALLKVARFTGRYLGPGEVLEATNPEQIDYGLPRP